MYPYSAIEKLDKKIMGNSCNVSILNPFRIVRSRDSRNNLLAMSVQFTIYLLGCLSISFFIYIPGKYRSGSCDHPSTKRKDMCFTNARHTHHRVTQSQQMQEYVLFLSSSLPWPCLFPFPILFSHRGVCIPWRYFWKGWRTRSVN